MRVLFSGLARRQTVAIDAWWRENRPAAPDLFADEIAAAGRLLATSPDVGAPYEHGRGALFRRVHLRRTQHHVYYVVDHDRGVVHVVAVRSMLRERGPKLSSS